MEIKFFKEWGRSMNAQEIISLVKSHVKEPLWENWYIKEKIGEGTFSVVYKIEAKRPTRTDSSALKIEAITSDGSLFYDETRKRSYIETRKLMIQNESEIMYKLRNSPYIVTYEEESVQELYVNGQFEGYLFLIKMELLDCVTDIIKSKKMDFSEKNIIKLALDIGRGIKAAHDFGVIHRDIKPGNFFLSPDGMYKLGDFNVSKKTQTAHTFAGTEGYLAPEIYRAKANADHSYTMQADIYSFGICLYQLMNNLYFPFEETSMTDDAIIRRMAGEKLVAPKNASDQFSKIILKACEFSISKRYKTIDEMLGDLQELETQMSSSKDNSNLVKTRSTTIYAGDCATQYADSIPTNHFATVYEDEKVKLFKKISRKKIKISIPILLSSVLLIIGIGVSIYLNTDHEKKYKFKPTEKCTSDMNLGEYITWTENGLFLVDRSLFGMTVDELNSLLEIELVKNENIGQMEYEMECGAYLYFHFNSNGECVRIENCENALMNETLKNNIEEHMQENFEGIYSSDFQVVFDPKTSEKYYITGYPENDDDRGVVDAYTYDYYDNGYSAWRSAYYYANSNIECDDNGEFLMYWLEQGYEYRRRQE